MWGRYRICLDREKSYVALDFETTGLDNRRHQIIEMAALRITPGQTTCPYFHRLVRAPRKLPARIVQITGITDDLLEREGGEVCEAVTGLVEFIGHDPIVTYNAPFDLGFLNAACETHAVPVKKRGGHSCALKLARRVLPGLPSYRLGEVAARLRLDISGEHRALGDARRAAEVYHIASTFYASA